MDIMNSLNSSALHSIIWTLSKLYASDTVWSFTYFVVLITLYFPLDGWNEFLEFFCTALNKMNSFETLCVWHSMIFIYFVLFTLHFPSVAGLAHATFHSEVRSHPEYYLHRDPELVPYLLRSEAWKHLFLLSSPSPNTAQPQPSRTQIPISSKGTLKS